MSCVVLEKRSPGDMDSKESGFYRSADGKLIVGGSVMISKPNFMVEKSLPNG